MLSALLFVVGVLVVGGLLFLAGSLLLGRGETQPPAELDRSPVELPDDRAVTGDDVRALQISVALRGYRMTEVDWLVDQFAQILDERDEEIAALRARLAATTGAGTGAPPGETPAEPRGTETEGAADGPSSPQRRDGEPSAEPPPGEGLSRRGEPRENGADRCRS